ncbi:hypothetical protein N0V88_007971 [Collariella sp. IMI 366227]|nr:hypothetical protein N0V88_007971 [Collariella sp. IMI 366227]
MAERDTKRPGMEFRRARVLGTLRAGLQPKNARSTGNRSRLWHPPEQHDRGGAPAVRVDMDLDIDIQLQAKIKGDIELSIL